MTQTDQNYEKTAILFADVEGSTRLYDTLGDMEAQRRIALCLDHIARVTTDHSGIVIKTIGDEIMCRFPDEDKAVKAACAIQESLENSKPAGDATPNFRIGLHYGLAIQKDGDIFGDAVNVAARMTAIARGKQIITTEDTVVNLAPVSGREVRKFDSTKVKGKQDEMVIYEVLWQVDNSNVTALQGNALSAIAVSSLLTLDYLGDRKEMSSTSPDFVLGRDPRCDIVINTGFSSRIHARIEYRRGKFVLIDQSTNGTYIKSSDGETMYLRREELPLLGSGTIALGEAISADTLHVVQYIAK